MEEDKMLAAAIAMSARAHCGQKRKDGTPYIYHPMKVAEMIKDQGYGLKYQAAAVLHDVIEDTDVTEEDLSAFGADVQSAVVALTRVKGTDEADYVRNVLDNPIAAVVKNADKIQNLEEAMEAKDKKFRRWYAKKAKKYYLGKFSPALDAVIEKAASMERPVDKDSSAFRLYPSASERSSEDAHAAFDPRDPGNTYYCLDDRYICIPKGEAENIMFGKVTAYILTQEGWSPRRMDMMPVWDELFELTRKQMEEEIRELAGDGWFSRNIDIKSL